MASDPIPVACTLGARDAASQIDEWAELRRHAMSVESIEGGARIELPESLEPTTRDLAEREAACCAFLSLTIGRDRDRVVLDITSDSPAGREVAALLAGLTTSASSTVDRTEE